MREADVQLNDNNFTREEATSEGDHLPYPCSHPHTHSHTTSVPLPSHLPESRPRDHHYPRGVYQREAVEGVGRLSRRRRGRHRARGQPQTGKHVQRALRLLHGHAWEEEEGEGGERGVEIKNKREVGEWMGGFVRENMEIPYNLTNSARTRNTTSSTEEYEGFYSPSSVASAVRRRTARRFRLPMIASRSCVYFVNEKSPGAGGRDCRPVITWKNSRRR